MTVMAFFNIPFAQLLPEPGWAYQLNCCSNPDCGNFGVLPDFSVLRLRGRSARLTRDLYALEGEPEPVGLGRYKLAGSSSAIKDRRTTREFEFKESPLVWSDERTMRCQHKLGDDDVCDTGRTVLSDQHLAEEIERIVTFNGVLNGPACGACGRRYLAAPNEFKLNGVNQASKASPDNGMTRTAVKSIRLIHSPCAGRVGSRFTVCLPHTHQRKSSDNLKILRAIVNSSGILDLQRAIAGEENGERCGVSRIYNRIYWLEGVLLAFEREQLAQWKERAIASGKKITHRISHDDIILGVNWQSDTDRRTTPLNCSVSADADSGYVYRIDVDFDPRVEPVALFREYYLDGNGEPKNLRKTYSHGDGSTFSAPLFHFQRPTGRLDEHAFFASCLNHIGVFRETKVRLMSGATRAERKESRDSLGERLKNDMDQIEQIYRGWFDLKQFEREYRASFSGVTVRQVYTKAAHFAALRESLPAGEICLMTEQEGTLTRTLPHIFREEIEADIFTWLIVSFDKNATKPVIEARTKAFAKELRAHSDAMSQNTGGEAPKYDVACLDFIMEHMSTAFTGGSSSPRPWPTTIFQGSAFPQVWVRSPIQSSGETRKVVGFPILKRDVRRRLKLYGFTEEITEPDLRSEIACEVWRATLQPVSTFMNSLRERLSPAARSGTGGARSGGSYVQGAMFNPRVLIALLNIFRVHYNFFELRTYVAPWNVDTELRRSSPGLSTARIPGSNETISIFKRRSRKARRLTPAMRHGVQDPPPGEDVRTPDLMKVLYKPWLFARTPLWVKFQNKHIDMRRSAPYADLQQRKAAKSPARKAAGAT